MSSGVALLRQHTSPGKVYATHHAEKERVPEDWAMAYNPNTEAEAGSLFKIHGKPQLHKEFLVSLGYRTSLFCKTELGLCLVGKVFAWYAKSLGFDPLAPEQ